VVLDGFLGDTPLGLRALGSMSEADAEGRVHFAFRIYLPWEYCEFLSVGWRAEDTDIDFEITRYALGLKESVTLDMSRVKSS
jgi:ribonuclease BN (tRNA processing enzyme)